MDTKCSCSLRLAKQLELFEASELHDCTIRVGSAASSVFKDFKCHKMVLGMDSCVFKTMFTGDFKEAKMGRDEPILLDKVEPQVFESAMKFVYGRVKDFKDVPFAVKIYKFAHEMQIDALTKELNKFFQEPDNREETFTIFDLYQALGIQKDLQWFTQAMEVNFGNDKHWSKISSESVEEFLRMDNLSVKEMNLVRALIRWGKFHVQNDGDDPNDREKLRSKILPGLKLIRFSALTETEFAELCQKELGSVLSTKETCSILMSLTIGDLELMPDLVTVKTPRANGQNSNPLVTGSRYKFQVSQRPNTLLGHMAEKSSRLMEFLRDFINAVVHNHFQDPCVGVTPWGAPYTERQTMCAFLLLLFIAAFTMVTIRIYNALIELRII